MASVGSAGDRCAPCGPARRRRQAAERGLRRSTPTASSRVACSVGSAGLFSFAGHEHEVLAPPSRADVVVAMPPTLRGPRCRSRSSAAALKVARGRARRRTCPRSRRRWPAPRSWTSRASPRSRSARRRSRARESPDGVAANLRVTRRRDDPRRQPEPGSAAARAEVAGRRRSTATGDGRPAAERTSASTPVSVARGGEGQGRAGLDYKFAGSRPWTSFVGRSRNDRPHALRSRSYNPATSSGGGTHVRRVRPALGDREVTSRSIRSLPEMARRHQGGRELRLEHLRHRRHEAEAAEVRLPVAAGDDPARQPARPRDRQRGRARGEGVGAREGRHPLLPLVPAADRPDRREARRLPDLRRRRPADGALQRRAADPERARRLELPVGRHAHAPSRPAATRPGTRRARSSSSTAPTARRCACPRSSSAITATRSTTRRRSCARWRCSPRSALAILRLFGDKTSVRVVPTLGPEQEYFLIDRAFYALRPDLVTAGRTLVGRQAAQGPGARGPLLRQHQGPDPGLHAGEPSTSSTSSGSPSRRATTRWPRASTRRRRSSRRRTSPPTTTRS